MRYLATGTITLPVMASFEDDGKPLEMQAREDLQVEVRAEFCLPWDQEQAIEAMQFAPVSE